MPDVRLSQTEEFFIDSDLTDDELYELLCMEIYCLRRTPDTMEDEAGNFFCA